MKNKIKIFTTSILALAALLCVLRSICMITSYDLSARYIERGFLPVLHTSLYVIGVAGCFAPLLLLPKDSTACKKALNRSGSVFAITSAAIFMICGILLALHAARNNMKLELIAGFSAILSALFFFFSAMSQHPTWSNTTESACPWLCIPSMATLLFLLASAYFDMTTTINGPFTTLFLFSALFGTVFFLCEMRSFMGRPAPRLHFASALATSFLAISSSIGNLIFCWFVTNGAERTASNPLRHLLILAVGIYAFARLSCFCVNAPVKTDDSNKDDAADNSENQQFEK